MMASSFPPKVLSLIAQHAAKQKQKLGAYALVNKSWQAAFENQIYSSLVVLSPSDTEIIRVSDSEQYRKHGLSLAKLEDITSGPREWRQARRAAIRHIFYRVAVPRWLSEDRQKDGDEEYTYDNDYRRENNRAFSEGVRLLFEYLSTWTQKRPFSLEIALQAESVSEPEDDAEPGSTVMDGLEDPIAPYRADFTPDCQLPVATCIASLDFPDMWSPTRSLGDDSTPSLSWDENGISVPAALTIAAACGGQVLQKVRLDDGHGLPLTEPAMRREKNISIAQALARLPSSVRKLQVCWSSPSEYEVPAARSPNEMAQPDPISTALHFTSLQLRELYIEDMAIFPEIFCPNLSAGLQFEANWPHLETLVLDQISVSAPFGCSSRYADGSSPEEILITRYIDELYTSLGHAVQKMPRIKRISLTFASIVEELKFLIRDGQWILRIYVAGDYKPSPRFLEAWKVPEGGWQPCKGPRWEQSMYSSWPPP